MEASVRGSLHPTFRGHADAVARSVAHEVLGGGELKHARQSASVESADCGAIATTVGDTGAPTSDARSPLT